MKVVFFGDNLEEVELLDKYFQKYIAPKEGLVYKAKPCNGYDYKYENGDSYSIRLITFNSKGCRCNRVYYTNTIYKNDNLNEDKMYLVYSLLIPSENTRLNDCLIELKVEDLEIDIK